MIEQSDCAIPKGNTGQSASVLKTSFRSEVQQNRSIKGVVKDASANHYRSFGRSYTTTTGTVTDMDGNFSLDVSCGCNLEISYVGYFNQTKS